MAARLRPRNVRLDPLDGQQRKLWPAEQGDLRTGSGLSTVITILFLHLECLSKLMVPFHDITANSLAQGTIECSALVF